MSPSHCCRLLLACISWAALGGCATLTESYTQVIEIIALDENDRPMVGMHCTVSNEGGEWTAVTPARQLEVRRSSTPLEVDCRRGALSAKGTVLSKGDSSMMHSFLPGGSLATLIDHASGAMYAYPSPLTLRLGQHLRFEHGGGARTSVVGDLGTPRVAQTPRPVAAPTVPPVAQSPTGSRAKPPAAPPARKPAPQAAVAKDAPKDSPARPSKTETGSPPVPMSGVQPAAVAGVAAEPRRRAPLTW